MRIESLRGALQEFRLVDGGLSDRQLLAQFIDGRNEAAFAALVQRHGPMVMGVCRRVLGNNADAEDTFQATFLVLACKARSVVRRDAVGGFLHGVAYRSALRAREKATRRRAMERQVEEMPHPEVTPTEASDWRPLLDRELSLLREKYRAALLLCDLEGKTRREAARVLGVPEGTVASRLATARRLLARRLAQCGVTLSAGAMAVALAEDVAAAVPARLMSVTVEAAALVAAGGAMSATAPAVALMNDVLRSMLMNKLKTCAGAVLAVALIIGVGVAHRAEGQAPGSVQKGQAAVGEAHPITELDLIRREVDILKMQVQLMQDKQRAQETELRALKGREGSAGTRSGSTSREPSVAPAGPDFHGSADPSVRSGLSPEYRPSAGRGSDPLPAGPTQMPYQSLIPNQPTETRPALPATEPKIPEDVKPLISSQRSSSNDRSSPPPNGTSPQPMKNHAGLTAPEHVGQRPADDDLDAAMSSFRDRFRGAPDFDTVIVPQK